MKSLKLDILSEVFGGGLEFLLCGLDSKSKETPSQDSLLLSKSQLCEVLNIEIMKKINDKTINPKSYYSIAEYLTGSLPSKTKTTWYLT